MLDSLFRPEKPPNDIWSSKQILIIVDVLYQPPLMYRYRFSPIIIDTVKCANKRENEIVETRNFPHTFNTTLALYAQTHTQIRHTHAHTHLLRTKQPKCHTQSN